MLLFMTGYMSKLTDRTHFVFPLSDFLEEFSADIDLMKKIRA